METIKSFWDLLNSLGNIIVGNLALLFSFFINIILIRENRKLKLLEQKNEYKQKIQYFDRAEIYKRLNSFYAPLQLLRRTSKELHNIFKYGRDFRTLPSLIGGDIKFTKCEKELLSEIIKIGDECRNIIIENSGLIDNRELRDIHLPKLLTHYILIKKAFNGEISEPSQRFVGYEFPNEIDNILDERVNKLYEDLNKLNSVD